jgi:L-glutamine-phosphate cytidylyltransferase
MKAIILAAGRGSRMKSITDDRPKCLVELKGRTLLDLQVSSLKAAGIDQISIVTGYKHELLSMSGIKEFHNSRWVETNMVASLACADEWLKMEPCIVSYSDIFYETMAVKSLIENQDSLAIIYDPNWLTLWEKRFSNPLIDAESFRLDEGHRILEIGKQPNSIQEIQGQYMGLLRFTPEGWNELVNVSKNLSSAIRDNIHMTAILQKIVEARNINITAIPYTGEWGEIDSRYDLELYSL